MFHDAMFWSVQPHFGKVKDYDVIVSGSRQVSQQGEYLISTLVRVVEVDRLVNFDAAEEGRAQEK